MTKLFLTFSIVFFSLQVNAQSGKEKLDSLYNSFLEFKNIKPENISQKILSEKPNIKCAFTLISEIKSNLQYFSNEQQGVIKKLLQRPGTQESIISPSGFFRIHYNITGNDVPNYDPDLSIEENVMQVALAADSAHEFEVNFLGYPAPPTDDTSGGDFRYDIYISGAAGNSYGYTDPENLISGQLYTSFLVIHYDFDRFFTQGFDAMKATVAHELHHAIQLGNYSGDGDKISEDRFFYELTSTAMEEFVFDDVNDYYAYIPNYLNNTSKPFSRFTANYDGYDLVLWAIYLQKKFGYDIIKSQWELFPQMRAISAMNNTINNNGSNFQDAFNEFGIWCFFTGYRAQPGQYFEEAKDYVPLQPFITFDFDNLEEHITSNSYPVSNNFISLINKTKVPFDTLTILVTNSDYNSGVSSPGQSFTYEYTLFNFESAGSRRLNEDLDYYSIFSIDNPNIWTTTEFLNSLLISNFRSTLTADYPYPSPFKYGRNNYIFIPISNPESQFADLNIYTSSMDLVYSKNQMLETSAPGIKWNVLDNKNGKLPSGVYIYIIKSGNKKSVGKLVIFNE